MHKFTIFTVILSIITISIVVDIVINGYSISQDYVPEKQVSILDSSDLEGKTVTELGDTEIPETTEEESIEPDAAKEADEGVNIHPEGLTEGETTINQTLLETVGLEQGSIKNAPEKPFLQAIELEETLKNSLKIVNLFDFEEYLGTIYELQFSSDSDARTVYSDIKAQAVTVQGAHIRETNAFGEEAFYFNQAEKTKTAFVTLRMGTHVYGFEYPHRSHQFFKDLSAAMIDSE